jgi:anaphase-promoting complex subunit 8
MELTLQQETGVQPNLDEDSEASDSNNDDDQSTAGGTRQRARKQTQNEDEEETWHGTGPTATTSKARLWLARWSLRHGDLERADQLAGELCQDGVEVEEAKALMRDVRARREAGE